MAIEMAVTTMSSKGQIVIPKNLRKNFRKGDKLLLLKKGEQHPIEKTGERLRGLMPWIKKRNLKGTQASYSN